MNVIQVLLALSVALAPVSAGAAEPLRAVCLSTITTEIVQKVGGARVEVVGLVKPGMDPHDYEPTPADLKAIADSDLVVASGKGIEGYLSKLRQSSGTKSSLLRVGDALPGLRVLPGTEDARKGEDPHWWHSIGAMQKAVNVVRDGLIDVRPADRDTFTKNAASYQLELDALKRWAAAEMARVPRDQRKLVTSHDAFQYFARDFGFTIYPIKGISSDDEPSSKKVAELIAIIRKQKVKAIFPESIENPKVMAEITRETAVKVAGKLYADGLGEHEAGTYDGMYRSNVRTIASALGEGAP